MGTKPSEWVAMKLVQATVAITSKSIPIEAVMRNDRKASPTVKHFRTLSFEECARELIQGSRALILDSSDKVVLVKITSAIKRDGILIVKFKFGLYDYLTINVMPDQDNNRFVTEIF